MPQDIKQLLNALNYEQGGAADAIHFSILTEFRRHELALERIKNLVKLWDANKMGGVALQRQRWQKLGQIASDALCETD